MKVFFSTSVSRKRYLLPVTQSLVSIIEELGHTVLTKHLVDPEYTKEPNWQSKYDPVELYNERLQNLRDSDVLITECTNPSFGAGFFIDKALEMGKPQLSLHWGYSYDNASLMLQGRKHEINLQMFTDENARAVLTSFFMTLSQPPAKSEHTAVPALA